MRVRRTALYALGGLLAIVVVALLAILLFGLGRFKPNVENLVSELTGREFEIAGRFEPSVGRRLHLVAEDIRLAATDWSNYDDLLSARRLEVTVDTWSLINGPVEIESITLEGVRIHLQRNEAGENNWSLGHADADVREPDQDDVRASLPVLIDRAEISDLQLIFDGPGRPRPLHLVVRELTELVVDSGHIQLTLDGDLNETAVTLNAAVGPVKDLIDYRNVAFDLKAGLGEIEIAGDGIIDDLLAPRRPEVQLRIDGPSAEYLMQILRLEPITRGPMSFAATLQPEGDSTVADVEGVFGEFDLLVNGRFVDLQEMQNVDLALAADGPDIGNVIRLLGGNYNEVDPFDLKATLQRSGSQLSVDEVTLNIGDSRLDLSGHFRDFPNVVGARAQLDISGPDFGRFNRLFGLPGRLDGSFTTSARLTPLQNDRAEIEVVSNAQDIQFRLEANVSGAPPFIDSRMSLHMQGDDVSVIASAAGLDDAPVEPFEIDGSVERIETGFVVNDFLALIGDDRVALDGVVGNEPLQRDTDLRFDASGTDIREILQVFGIKSERLPDGPFRAVGRLQRSEQHYSIEKMRASIGSNQEYVANIDGTITNFTDFEGSRVVVGLQGSSTAAVADLAGWPDVPDVSYDLTATIERFPRFFEISNGSANLGTVSARISGKIGEDPPQRDTDLSFQIEVPDLSYSLNKFGIEVQDIPSEELRLAGKVRSKAGRLAMEQINLGFAGMVADIDGDLGVLPDFEGADVNLGLSGDDFSRLLPDDKSSESLAVRYKGSAKVRVASSQLELGDAQFTLGNVNLTGDVAVHMDPLLSNGRFDLHASSPDLFELYPKLTEVSVPQSAAMQFAGKGSWNDNFWEFDNVILNLGEGGIELNGSIDGPPDFDRTNLEFDLRISSLRRLSIIAGRELPDHSARLRARLSGTRDQMTMEEFVGQIGDSDISGDFSMRGGEKPMVSIAFTSDRLNLAPYLPPLEDEKQDDPASQDGRLIPDTKLPMEFLNKFDALVDVNIGEFAGRSTIVRNFEVNGAIDAGSLQLSRIALAGQRGGSLAAGLSLRPNSDGGGDLVVNADGSDLILGLHAGKGVDIEGLPLFDLTLDLAGTGATLREIAASLNGSLRVVGAEGRITANSMSVLTGDVFDEVISAVNPFVKSDPFTSVECSAFLLHITDGRATGAPAFIQKTDKLLVYANADINLANERLRVDLNSVPQRGLGLSFSGLITPWVQLTGTLAKPTLSLNPESTIVQGGAAVATAGLSLLAKSLKDRYFSSRDPCGDAVRRHDEIKVETKADRQE